jgi:hypothetical protein
MQAVKTNGMVTFVIHVCQAAGSQRGR